MLSYVHFYFPKRLFSGDLALLEKEMDVLADRGEASDFADFIDARRRGKQRYFKVGKGESTDKRHFHYCQVSARADAGTAAKRHELVHLFLVQLLILLAHPPSDGWVKYMKSRHFLILTTCRDQR